jgi:hypothetical protein
MEIAECINVENIDETGGEGEVLQKTRKHMPRIPLEMNKLITKFMSMKKILT